MFFIGGVVATMASNVIAYTTLCIIVVHTFPPPHYFLTTQKLKLKKNFLSMVCLDG